MQGVHTFKPNDMIHGKFGEALRRAADCGVKILVLDRLVESDSITVNRQQDRYLIALKSCRYKRFVERQFYSRRV